MDISYLIHSPAEIYANGQRYLERRRDKSVYGIPIGLGALDRTQPGRPSDERFLPVWPGEMISVIGRPGNGKTGLMMWWARAWANKLRFRGDDNRCVLYVTYEQTIEELNAFNLAAETGVNITDMANGDNSETDWEKIKQAGVHRSELPLWFMGYSSERRSGEKPPEMTVRAIGDAVRAIQNWSSDSHREVDMVFVDYLQNIPFPGQVESKTVGHSEQLRELKNLTLELCTRTVIGVQAKREVEQKTLPIPSQEDGQWTSNIEQASDGILTVCRPRKYKQEGEEFGSQIVRGDTQMIITVAKRKLAPDNFARWVFFDPRYNHLDNLEMRHVDLNNLDNYRNVSERE